MLWVRGGESLDGLEGNAPRLNHLIISGQGSDYPITVDLLRGGAPKLETLALTFVSLRDWTPLLTSGSLVAVVLLDCIGLTIRSLVDFFIATSSTLQSVMLGNMTLADHQISP